MASANMPPRPEESKPVKWIFNPPPGWSVPPVGWQPPPGWQPDPAWPPAPPGWNFWRPAEKPKRRRVSNLVKAVVGTITLVATVAGAYYGYKAWKDSQPTTVGWTRDANAACEQDIGPITESIFTGLASSPATQSEGSAQSSQVEKVGAFVTAVGDLSKLVGDLAALQMPQDSRTPEVQAVLSSGNALLDSLQTFSGAAQEAVENTPGTTLAQDLATEKTADQQYDKNLVVWRKAIGALGLTQCPFWVSNPNAPVITTPATTPPPVSSLSPAEQQLVDNLDANDLDNCTSRPAEEGGDIVAAVNCDTVQTGPSLRPLVVQFSDLDAAEEWFDSNTTDFVNQNDCAAGYRLGTWTHDYAVSGLLGCAYRSGTDFRMVWILDNSLIGVIADGTNGQVMYDWWTHSAYVTNGEN
jgi:hypothetical protein